MFIYYLLLIMCFPYYPIIYSPIWTIVFYGLVFKEFRSVNLDYSPIYRTIILYNNIVFVNYFNLLISLSLHTLHTPDGLYTYIYLYVVRPVQNNLSP